jgi:hypothetical protein
MRLDIVFVRPGGAIEARETCCMFAKLAGLVVDGAAAYGLVGAVVALAFLFVGLDRVDPAARGAYAFRPLLVPGLVLLCPLVLWRWLALERRR